MKLLIGLVALTISYSVYAAEIKRNTVEPNGKTATVVVNKKPLRYADKQKFRKELQNTGKQCYAAYDKKTRNSYVLCK